MLCVPIDLSLVEDLDTLTSEWLLTEVFSKLPTDKSSPKSKVPVCLATIDNQAESVDYFLTKANEPISNFLALDTPLKLCYALSSEINLAKEQRNEQPQIQDFHFIKILGKGGFATVYMGKHCITKL